MKKTNLTPPGRAPHDNQFGYAPHSPPGTAPHARDLSAALRFVFVPPHFVGGGHLCRPQYASRSLSGGVCSRSSSTPGGFTLRERSISSIHNSFPLQSARPQVREPGVRADIVANAVEREGRAAGGTRRFSFSGSAPLVSVVTDRSQIRFEPDRVLPFCGLGARRWQTPQICGAIL